MTKQEFESRATRGFTDTEYKIIEKVYTFHPSVDPVKGKDQIADLFSIFGMRVILDMLPTAEKAEKLEAEIRETKHKLDSLINSMNKLAEGIL